MSAFVFDIMDAKMVRRAMTKVGELARKLEREPRQPDFAYVDHGSMLLLRPLNSDAWEWVADHIPPDSYTLWGGAIPVERKLFQPILDGIEAAGFTYTD